MNVETSLPHHDPARDLVIRRSDGDEPATQLMLLFHGVGATPHDLVPLGARLASAFPAATIVSVAAARPGSMGSGREWFSVVGIDEASRPARIAAAMPAFHAAVAHWQRESGVTAHGTALVGFSQGAIMALASTQPLDGDDHAAPPPALAGRIVALSGRFATLPTHVPAATTLHFIHGKSDPVIPYRFTVEAAEHLIAHGGDVTADVIPFLGHGIDDAVINLVVERLSTHIPKRVWEEALRAAPRG